MKINILIVVFILVCAISTASATTVTVSDTSNNTNMELQFFNTNGSLETSIISNNSQYTFNDSMYTIKILPISQHYENNPTKILFILLDTIRNLFGVFLALIAGIAMALLIKKLIR